MVNDASHVLPVLKDAQGNEQDQAPARKAFGMNRPSLHR